MALYEGFFGGQGGASGVEAGPGPYAIDVTPLNGGFYVAAAFDGGDGLPTPGPFGSASDFFAYVDAVEAKQTQITTTDVQITVTGLTGIALILGGEGGDTIQVSSSSSGRAFLMGRDGDDNLIGGDGDDQLAPGAGNDSADGGAGTSDTADYADALTGVTVSLALQGSAQATGIGSQILDNFENLTGSDHNDRIAGDAGDNILTGGKGKDHVAGGDGDDHIFSLGDGDRLFGGAGKDVYEFDDFATSTRHMTRVAVLGVLDNNDTVDLTPYAAKLGNPGDYTQFKAVNAFDGQADNEILATYKAHGDRTIFTFDVDGDGHADHRLVVERGDYSDYSHFFVVDTSGLTV